MRIGIDHGGMSIKAGLVNENYEIIYKDSVVTDVAHGGEKIVSDIIGLIKSILEKYPDSHVDGIGIGVPGHVDKEQMVKNCNNIPLSDIDLRAEIKAATGIEVGVDNDANVAALGEVLAGAAKEYHDAVMITIGTGIGSGIIINDRILRGCNGAAGELGHDVIVKGGIPCNCGRNGCYEKYASATALIEYTKEAMRSEPDSVMWELCGGDIEAVNGKTSFDAWRQNDPAGIAVVNRFISYLALGIVNVVNIFQPDAVILGGGISKEGDTLIGLIEDILVRERYSQSGVQSKLLIAKLGNDAGIIGASQLV